MVRSVVTRLGMVIGGLLVVCASPAALAQDHEAEQCAPVIGTLSQTVIDGSQSLPPLQARRFGTRALYLMLHYGARPAEEIRQLLDAAIEARVHGAEDLDFAWRLHRDGLEATLATLGPDVLAAAVDTGRPSSVRALLLNGHAEAVMSTIAGMPEGSRFGPAQMVVTASFDQPDAFKAELGTLAESHGLPWLAAGLAAAQQDATAWDRQVEGLSATEIDELAGTWAWTPTFLGNPILTRSTDRQDDEAVATRAAIGLVNHAWALQPEYSLLGAYLNQTGKAADSAAVAKSLLKQFSSGALTATGPFDAGWLAMIEAFAANGENADAFHDLLGTLSLGINRAGRQSVGEVLDWIVAVDAFTPYLTGTGAMPESPPETLSSAFADWNKWQSLAEAVHDAPETAVADADAADLPILAELLLAAGRRDLLATMVSAAPATLESVGIAEDFAGRIDRLCDASLWHRGEAPLLAGQAIYKFEQAGD